MKRRTFLGTAAAPMIASPRIFGANSRLKIGVIGVGNRARWLMQYFGKELDEVDVVGEFGARRRVEARQVQHLADQPVEALDLGAVDFVEDAPGLGAGPRLEVRLAGAVGAALVAAPQCAGRAHLSGHCQAVYVETGELAIASAIAPQGRQAALRR